MADQRNIVVPVCKYGHGELLKTPEKWAYRTCNSNDNVIFSGDLYVCSSCGYTEFFDDDFLATKASVSAE